MGHRVELQAAASSPVDYCAVFQQAAPACLLLWPDAPRFSVAAASAAFFATTGAPAAPASGRGLSDFLAASGVALHADAELALVAALERVVGARAPARVPLAGAACGASSSGPAPLGDAVLTPVLRGDALELIALELARAGADGPDTASLLAERTRELEHTRCELLQARAELEAFGYSVSHDLRSPLRAIDGFAQALAQDYGDTLEPPALHHLERVRAGAQRMSSLLDDLLELSRVQLAPLTRARVDVSELARRLGAELAAAHPGRGPSFSVEDGLELFADPRLSRLLLLALLDNAWKFTSKQSSASVRVARDPSRAATLLVEDDGVGFDMAYARRLFAPFQRLHRAAEYPGNGIGLAVAQRIVSRHGGRIWAEASPGRGACFRFCMQAGGDE